MLSKEDIGKAVSDPVLGNGILIDVEDGVVGIKTDNHHYWADGNLVRLGHVDWDTDEKTWEEFFQNRVDSIGAPGVPTRTAKEDAILLLQDTRFSFLIPMLESIEFSKPYAVIKAPSDALWGQFEWVATPQGGDFWAYFHEELCNAGL